VASVHLVWTRPGPVQAERGVEITATTSFADAPALDILLVPVRCETFSVNDPPQMWGRW
jgi:transcriptional regulator GlxA family with amidase domain